MNGTNPRNQRARQPKGVPSGGQFAKTHRPEASLDLELDALQPEHRELSTLATAGVLPATTTVQDVHNLVTAYDSPAHARITALNTYVAGTARLAMNDPDPLVRAHALTTGWDLTPPQRDQLAHDRDVRRVLEHLHAA